MDAPSAQREDTEGIIARGTTTGQTVDVAITEQVVYFTQRCINGQGTWGRTLLKEGLVRLEAQWASYLIRGSEFLKLEFVGLHFMGRDENAADALGREKAQ